MMRMLTAAFLCGTMSPLLWATPGATFIGDGPGINVPFLDSGAVATYGVPVVIGEAWWRWDGTGGKTISSGTLARYRPSFADDNENYTAMPTDQDWVFEISTKQEEGFGTEWPFLIKNELLDKRILVVQGNQDGTYNIDAANQDNMYTTVAVVSLPLGEWGDFVFHYKAITETVDAYFNGALVAGDFAVQLASADWVQIESQRLDPTGADTTTWFRNIKLGQVIPEPLTLVASLLGIAGLGGYIRRRRLDT